MNDATKEKLLTVMLTLKALAEPLAKTDPVYVELATALACTGRARRLMLERGGEP